MKTHPDRSVLGKNLPLGDHLGELRGCIIRSLCVVGVASIIGFVFSKDIFLFLRAPIERVLPEQSRFIVIHPLETWLVYLKVGLLTGCAMSVPYWAYEVWRFVSPGLLPKERRWLLPTSLGLGILFVVGAVFGYKLVFPIGFKAFVDLAQSSDVWMLPTMNNYFSLIFRLLLAFGIVFELPLIVFVLAVGGFVPFYRFVAFQKYLIVSALVLGAVLTPPDPVTQIFMAIPLVLLYELGLGLAWVGLRVRKQL